MSRSARTNHVHPITTRALDVVAVHDVTPGMRRVTLAGEQLRAFTSSTGHPVGDFSSTGFDDNLKIVLRHPDLDEPLVPVQGDGAVAWPRDTRLITRTYTIRRWDPRAGEADIDFVLHGDGPAAQWAWSVQPGETLHVAGPKMSRGFPEGVDWALIAGDETALPAIGRWIEECPRDLRAQVFVEVAEECHRQELAPPDGVTVTWLVRGGAPAGSTTLLHDAVTGMQWWDGTVFAWVAGESTSLAPIRRWLRDEKEVPKSHLEVVGYWRRSEDRGPAEPDPADALGHETGTETETGTVAEAVDLHGDLHDRLDLVTPFAVRVAVTTGLLAALGQGPMSAAELADHTGTHSTGVSKLLRYLASQGAVTLDAHGLYRLTAAGEELTDEWHTSELDLTGMPARRELGVLAMLAAVRTGRGDYESWFGSPFHDIARGDPAAIAADEDEADVIADTLAASPLFDGLSRLVITGRGAGRLGCAFVDARDDLVVVVAGLPSELSAVAALHGPRDRVILEPSSLLDVRADAPDGVLFATVLDLMPDEDAVHRLRAAGRSITDTGSVFVFATPLDPVTAEDYEYSDDLLHFALTGGGSRTDEEYRSLFAAADLSVRDRVTIGWGEVIYRVAPTVRGD